MPPLPGSALAPAAEKPGRLPLIRVQATRFLLLTGVCVPLTAIFLLGYYVLGELFAHSVLWGLLASAGVLVLLIGTAALVWRGRRWRWASWLSCRAWRMGAAFALICLSLTAGGALGNRDFALPCAIPVEIPVLASTENLAAVQAAVTRFEQAEPVLLHQSCYAADLTAYAARSDDAAAVDLESGWGPAALSADGPRPAIWLPSSTEEIGAVNSHASSAVPGLAELGSTASSPLIVAVPTPLIDRDDIYDAERHGNWGAIYRTLQGHHIGLNVQDPEQSATGLLGVTGLYTDLKISGQQQIAASGNFPTDSGMLLCAAAQAVQNGHPSSSAYLVSEAALKQYNQGQLTEGACPTLDLPLPPLTSLNPSDAASLDFPFVTLDWGGSSVPANRAHQYELDFYQWLTGSAGQSVLQSYGLRPSQPAMSSTEMPSQSQLQAELRLFTTKTPAARILVAIDDSGPMQSYLQPIAAAVTEVLGTGKATSIGSRDSFGIWAFPGAGSSTYRSLVSFGDGTNAQRDTVAASTARLSAHSHSAEFDLVVQAAQQLYGLSARSARTVSSVVLLTDGDDYRQDPRGSNLASMQSVLRALGANQPAIKVFVIAFGGRSSCGESPPGNPGATLSALAADTGGSCAVLGDLGQQLGQLVSQLSAGG